MVGTDLKTKGGISSVVQGYFDAGIMGRLGIHYYPTHRDGSRSDKVFFYMRGLFKIIINMPKYDIVHVHTASWWSFRRLFLVIFLAKILHKKIVIHALKLMKRKYQTRYKDIRAAFGPAMHACCFEADKAFARRFPKDTIPSPPSPAFIFTSTSSISINEFYHQKR